LLSVQNADVAMLDRWALSFKNNQTKQETKQVIFNNYFGVGK
jgi:hypothetical protein